ncbi:MAG: PIN domain-containing protein [Candidatus Paceibacterota bacterium]|jgi:predicted nucleic acid-binding protein
MKLFIDTNIWIYYLSSKTDLDSFKKLKNLIKEKKIDLVVPRQMHQEYLKHSTRKIEEEREKVSQEIQISVPDGLSKDSKQIISKIESINKELKELTKERFKSFELNIAELEKIFEELFLLATFIEDNDEILDNAEKRFFKNLPPKKDSKKGDAIIWETLKVGIKKEKLTIIAKDSDYSDVEKGQQVIKKLLKKEWEDHTGKSIVLYTSLGEFINTIEKKKIISDKIIEQENKFGNIVWHSADSVYSPPTVIRSIPPKSGLTYVISSETSPISNMFSGLGSQNIAYVSARKCISCGNSYIHSPTSVFIDNGMCYDCQRSGRSGISVIGGL